MNNKLYRVRTLGDIKNILNEEGDGTLLYRGESHFSSSRLTAHRRSFPECIGIFPTVHYRPSFDKKEYEEARSYESFYVSKESIYKPPTRLATWVDFYEKLENSFSDDNWLSPNYGLNIPVFITDNWEGRTGDQIQYKERRAIKVGMEVVAMRGEDFKSKFFNFYGYEDSKDSFGFAQEWLRD